MNGWMDVTESAVVHIVFIMCAYCAELKQNLYIVLVRDTFQALQMYSTTTNEKKTTNSTNYKTIQMKCLQNKLLVLHKMCNISHQKIRKQNRNNNENRTVCECCV